jgi:coproporphyrinogen III oxidase
LNYISPFGKLSSVSVSLSHVWKGAAMIDEKIVSFVEKTRETVIEKLLEISGGGELTRKTVPFKVGQADVAVIRGGAIEKASITHMKLNQVQPPQLDRVIDYMVFQVEIFPENPLVPMGHFNTEWGMTGEGPYHMMIDVFPAVADEQMYKAARISMDGIAEKFGVDKEDFRAGLADQYRMAHWGCSLAAEAGCRLMHLGPDRLDRFIASYRTFFDSYIELLAAHKDRPYSQADVKQKLRRNGRWLEYLTLQDVAVKMGLGVGIPPGVLVELSYPPSAEF